MTSRAEALAADVLVGEDGFLFNRFEKAIEQVCDATLPDDRFLARWASLIETRRAWCVQRGVGYVTLIMPARHAVYDDKLPVPLAVSPNRAALRLMRMITPALRSGAVYPEAELRDARALGDVFLRTDEHVNDLGAYVCYCALLRAASRTTPLEPAERETFKTFRRRIVGNLGVRLASEPSEEAEFFELPGRGPPRAGIRNRKGDRGVDIFLNDNSSLPSAVVFGDSNIHPLIPFLRPHFSRIVSLPANQRLFYDLVRSEAPHVVFNLVSELTLGHEAAGIAPAPIDNDAGDFVDYYDDIAGESGRALLLAIDFSRKGDAPGYLGEGWSHAEDNHTWMIGALSELVMPALSADLARGGLAQIEIECFPFLAPPLRLQRLAVEGDFGAGWRPLATLSVSAELRARIAAPLDELANERRWRLRFSHPDALSPSSVSESADHRALSVALRNLSVWADPRPADRSVAGALDALMRRKPQAAPKPAPPAPDPA